MRSLNIITAIIVSTFVSYAHSQSPIEEIVVTSMKRSNLLSETPASVSTMESSEINLKAVIGPQDIKFQVPSMSYTSIFGEPYITIRGVSGFNNAPGVSVSIDGIYQSRSTSSILGGRCPPRPEPDPLPPPEGDPQGLPPRLKSLSFAMTLYIVTL